MIEPLFVGSFLSDALDHPLEVEDLSVLLGVQEDGGLLPTNHQEHVHLCRSFVLVVDG